MPPSFSVHSTSHLYSISFHPYNMSDFHQKAAAAAQRLVEAGSKGAGEVTAAAAASITLQESMAQNLAQDRPTIEAAIKSYMSLVSARYLTKNELGKDNQETSKCFLSSPNALVCGRVLSKAINSYIFAVDAYKLTLATEQSVAAQLWNGLVASNQKPTRFFGRKALSYAFDDLSSSLVFPEQVDSEKGKQFVCEFGALLMIRSGDANDDDDDADHDGALLWDADGGKNELERRRKRRTKRAAAAAQPLEQQETSLPMIEELDDDGSPIQDNIS